MKKLLVYVLCVYFLCACSDSAKEQDKSESAKLVESYPQIVALLEKESKVSAMHCKKREFLMSKLRR